MRNHGNTKLTSTGVIILNVGDFNVPRNHCTFCSWTLLGESISLRPHSSVGSGKDVSVILSRLNVTQRYYVLHDILAGMTSRLRSIIKRLRSHHVSKQPL